MHETIGHLRRRVGVCRRRSYLSPPELPYSQDRLDFGKVLESPGGVYTPPLSNDETY